jgi:formamidopyrimidine-DNA glycosylase
MPELPDVEIFKQYLDANALHRRIARTTVQSRDLLRNISATQLSRALRGKKFKSSHRHGKFLFVAVTDESWLVLHFGMTGFLKYFKNRADAPPHSRVLIGFTNGYHLAFDCKRKLGQVRLINSIDNFIQQRKLGPDALDARLDLPAFKKIMRDTGSAVKPALMNQKRIAGIGNVYSDEILFRAGIHPARTSAGLDDISLQTLYHAMRTTLQKVIEYGAEVERFPKSYLLPHRAGDGRCPRCGRNLKREKFSGRTAYYCPKDQKRMRTKKAARRSQAARIPGSRAAVA